MPALVQPNLAPVPSSQGQEGLNQMILAFIFNYVKLLIAQERKKVGWMMRSLNVRFTTYDPPDSVANIGRLYKTMLLAWY